MADLMIPTEFGLSEERKMMLDMLKKFKEKECPKDKIGEWDEENHFPVDVWKKLGDEGILGACFPEEFGGTGGNIIDEVLITEEISNSFSGVSKTYAIQAGREVRVMVEQDSVDDRDADLLADDIAGKIQNEMTYPGQIKVTVIREHRSVSYAK